MRSRAATADEPIDIAAATRCRLLNASHELQRNAPERAEVGADGVTLLRPYHPGERARQDEMAGFQRRTERPELVGEPGNAHCRVTEHTGRDPRLLDLGI